MQTVTYKTTLPITDADGNPVIYTKVIPLCDSKGRDIQKGSVLENVKDKGRGVVTHIYKLGDRSVLGLACEGDISIRTSAGTSRITNQYSQWRHIPPAEQTYEERFHSWLSRPYEHDEFKQCSQDEGAAIDGIMALLPPDIVNWEYGPWPDRIEDALRFLLGHLQEITNQTK